MKEVTLRDMLDNAKDMHERADTAIDVAYWQGRKDAIRTVLAVLLNITKPLAAIESSLFSWEQARRDFQPVPAESITDDIQCIECGQIYFHKKGCLHGLGLSTEQFSELLKAGKIDTYLARRRMEGGL